MWHQGSWVFGGRGRRSCCVCLCGHASREGCGDVDLVGPGGGAWWCEAAMYLGLCPSCELTCPSLSTRGTATQHPSPLLLCQDRDISLLCSSQLPFFCRLLQPPKGPSLCFPLQLGTGTATTCFEDITHPFPTFAVVVCCRLMPFGLACFLPAAAQGAGRVVHRMWPHTPVRGGHSSSSIQRCC